MTSDDDWTAARGRSAGNEPAVLEPGAVQTVEPRAAEPDLDGGHERMSHIVLEGFVPDDGEYIAAGPSVVEGIVNGTAVKALCGKVWVPKHNPQRYPLCPTCKEIAEANGWAVPAS